MKVVIKERWRSTDDKYLKSKLDEATTPAAETLITYIRQWPDQYKSRNQALGRLLECDRWNDKGELVLECDFKGRPYPMELPLDMAYEAYQFGDQRQTFFPMYSFPDGVKRIPENVTEDWADEIKGLFHDINKLTLSAVKIISLGKQVKCYGVNNPHAFAHWDRIVSEWKDAQAAIDAFAATRKGWEYLTIANIQNPKHSEEMSKVITELLAKADEIVEPSVKAIREQDRKMYIGQDATVARNDVKTLRAFFKKYGAVESASEVLETLSNKINNVESVALNPQTSLTKVYV